MKPDLVPAVTKVNEHWHRMLHSASLYIFWKKVKVEQMKPTLACLKSQLKKNSIDSFLAMLHHMQFQKLKHARNVSMQEKKLISLKIN